MFSSFDSKKIIIWVISVLSFGDNVSNLAILQHHGANKPISATPFVCTRVLHSVSLFSSILEFPNAPEAGNTPVQFFPMERVILSGVVLLFFFSGAVHATARMATGEVLFDASDVTWAHAVNSREAVERELAGEI